MDETLAKKIIDYANTRQFRITRKLGSENQGLVYAALQHGAINEIAVKFHREPEAYLREKRVYERLTLHAVSQIEGFNAPELVLTDDAEMFEDRWPMVEKVMFGLRLFGIYLMDIHPRNIAFLDEG